MSRLPPFLVTGFWLGVYKKGNRYLKSTIFLPYNLCNLSCSDTSGQGSLRILYFNALRAGTIISFTYSFDGQMDYWEIKKKVFRYAFLI